MASRGLAAVVLVALIVAVSFGLITWPKPAASRSSFQRFRSWCEVEYRGGAIDVGTGQNYNVAHDGLWYVHANLLLPPALRACPASSP